MVVLQSRPEPMMPTRTRQPVLLTHLEFCTAWESNSAPWHSCCCSCCCNLSPAAARSRAQLYSPALSSLSLPSLDKTIYGSYIPSTRVTSILPVRDQPRPVKPARPQNLSRGTRSLSVSLSLRLVLLALSLLEQLHNLLWAFLLLQFYEPSKVWDPLDSLDVCLLACFPRLPSLLAVTAYLLQRNLSCEDAVGGTLVLNMSTHCGYSYSSSRRQPFWAFWASAVDQASSFSLLCRYPTLRVLTRSNSPIVHYYIYSSPLTSWLEEFPLLHQSTYHPLIMDSWLYRQDPKGDFGICPFEWSRSKWPFFYISILTSADTEVAPSQTQILIP